jgi:hypothetical protein
MTRTDKHVQPAQLTIPHAAGFDGTVTLFETRRVLQSEDVSTAAGNQLGLLNPGFQTFSLEFRRQPILEILGCHSY